MAKKRATRAAAAGMGVLRAVEAGETKRRVREEILEESPHSPLQGYGRDAGRKQEGQGVNLARFEQGLEAPECCLRLPGAGLGLGDDDLPEVLVFHCELKRCGFETCTVLKKHVTERAPTNLESFSAMLDI